MDSSGSASELGSSSMAAFFRRWRLAMCSLAVEDGMGV